MINKIIKELVNAVFCILMIGLFFTVHIDITLDNILKLSLIGFLCSWFSTMVFSRSEKTTQHTITDNEGITHIISVNDITDNIVSRERYKISEDWKVVKL